MKTIEHIRDFLDAFIPWASEQTDVQGIALVGSYARGTAGNGSDIDLVILTDRPPKYLEDILWIEQFGLVEKYQTEDYGKLTSLRVWYQHGIEVEYGITTHERPSLAACALSDMWETWTQQEELPNARKMGCSLIIYFFQIPIFDGAKNMGLIRLPQLNLHFVTEVWVRVLEEQIKPPSTWLIALFVFPNQFPNS